MNESSYIRFQLNVFSLSNGEQRPEQMFIRQQPDRLIVIQMALIPYFPFDPAERLWGNTQVGSNCLLRNNQFKPGKNLEQSGVLRSMRGCFHMTEPAPQVNVMLI